MVEGPAPAMLTATIVTLYVVAANSPVTLAADTWAKTVVLANGA